jgi:DinB superfamily
MTEHLLALFKRDLEKLVLELEAYSDASKLWVLAGEIKNPAGNLVLHLHGNLNHFVGKVLGKLEFVRDREAEFSRTDVPRAELIAMVRATSAMLETVLPSLSPEDLEQPYPLEVLGYPMTIGYFLIHLYGHLNWHLGQVNYHRRLV